MTDFIFVALVISELFSKTLTYAYVSKTTISKANRAKVGPQFKPTELYRHIYF